MAEKDLLVHETLISAVSLEKIMNRADYLNAHRNALVSG